MEWTSVELSQDPFIERKVQDTILTFGILSSKPLQYEKQNCSAMVTRKLQHITKKLCDQLNTENLHENFDRAFGNLCRLITELPPAKQEQMSAIPEMQKLQQKFSLNLSQAVGVYFLMLNNNSPLKNGFVGQLELTPSQLQLIHKEFRSQRGGREEMKNVANEIYKIVVE
jgi:hypothetical protein